MAHPEIAVVVATRDRPASLSRCLKALLQQTLPPEHYEIIVVDDGRSVATRAAVQEAAAHAGGMPAVRYLLPAAGLIGPMSARDCGWRASAALVIAFTADDMTPDPEWLRRGLLAVSSGPTAGPVGAGAFVERTALEQAARADERETKGNGPHSG